jgi:two-component system, OmpR family, response regulator
MTSQSTAQGGEERDRPTGAPRRTVLLALADPDFATSLASAFAFHGFDAIVASTAAEALATTPAAVSPGPHSDTTPALVVMDLEQPDADGLVLCADLRFRLGPGVPILVCGGSDQRRDALLAFRLGADDFIAHPVEVDALIARAEVSLRHRPQVQTPTEEAPSQATQPAPVQLQPNQTYAPQRASAHMGRPRGARPVPLRPAMQSATPAQSSAISVGSLWLDPTHHRVGLGDQELKLSRSEYLLLSALMTRPDELLSRLDLARAVWGDQLASVGRPIDQHMYRLRSKLQVAASAAHVAPPAIVSVPGFGYRLLDADRSARASA